MIKDLAMNTIFVPYNGKKPAALSINGHNLIILSTTAETFKANMDMLGADHIKKLKVYDSPAQQERAISKLAKKIGGGVVISPQDIELPDLIRNLEHELPWVQ